MEDNVRAFYRKLLVWQERVKSGNLAAFPTMLDLLDDNDRKEPPTETQSHIRQHLENLSQQFLSYYPFMTEDSDGGNEWIFSPFSMDAVSKAKITTDLQDNITDMMTDRRFQTIFKEKSLSEFWCEVSKDYPFPGRSAVTALLPLGSTYLSERTFSAMALISTKQGNCMQLKPDLNLAVSTIPPRIDKLMSSRQAQVSH
jgi:hypothetical protein